MYKVSQNAPIIQNSPKAVSKWTNRKLVFPGIAPTAAAVLQTAAARARISRSELPPLVKIYPDYGIPQPAEVEKRKFDLHILKDLTFFLRTASVQPARALKFFPGFLDDVVDHGSLAALGESSFLKTPKVMGQLDRVKSLPVVLGLAVLLSHPIAVAEPV